MVRRIVALALSFALAGVASACDDSGADPAPADGGGGGETPAILPATISAPLRAGASVRALDIPVGHSHAGYLQSARLGYRHPADDPKSPFAGLFPASRGIESPPAVRVLALENGHGRLFFAKLDVIFVTAELHARVVGLARESLGLELEDALLLTASHTHAGPCRFSGHSVLTDFLANEPPEGQEALVHGVDSYSQESVDRMAGSIVAAIEEAIAAEVPATWGWAAGENTTASSDRRCQDDWLYGEDNIDRAVTVLRVDDAATGKPISVLFHFAFHGTVNGSDNRALSTDAPGHAEYAVEQLFPDPVVAIHLQGTAGDVSPRGDRAGHRGTQRMQNVGADLASTVMTLWTGIDASRAELKLATLDRSIPLAHSLLGYEDGQFFEHGGVLCNQFESECRSSRLPEDALLCLGVGTEGGGKYQTTLTVARLDELAIMSMPGEATSEVGRRLKALGAAQGFTHTIVPGYAQNHEGYILVEDDWWSGGYEPTISFWGPKFADWAIAQNGDLLGELLTGEAPAKLPAPRQDLTPRPYTPFAATSSPRAPAELEPLPAQAPRFTELRWRFEGGDPALGNPLVQLVHEDGTPVLHNGWLPITSTRTGDLPFLYESDPTYKAAPTATERTHTFTFVYELPPELPLGTYRLRATGRVKLGGQVQDFTLDGSPFTVVPGALPLDVALVAEAGGVRLSITPRWPAADPVWAPSPNDEWQIGRFRMLDRGFGRGFVPVLGAVVTAAATVQSGADAPIPITLADNGLAAPSQGGEPWAAGDGPGLTGVAAGLGAGLYTVTVPAGAVEDAFGNRNEATSVERTAP